MSCYRTDINDNKAGIDNDRTIQNSRIIKSSNFLTKFILLFLIFSFVLSASFILNPTEAIADESVIIDLEYRETDIKDVIRSLAVAADVNIIVDDSAEGEVTVQLQAVTFREAFDHLLKIKDLDYYQEGNLLIVATPDRLEELYYETERELYSLEHLEPEEARDVLAEIVPGLNVQTLPTERRLILQGFAEQIREAEEFLADIDTPRDRAYEIVSLEEQSPEAVADELEALYPDLTIRPRPAAGDLIIQGRSSDVQEAVSFIERLDVPDRDVERFYRVREVEAAELAAEVEGLYPEERLTIRVQNNLIFLDGSPEAVEDVYELLEELDEKEEVKEQRRIRADYIDLEELRDVVADMEPELDLATSPGERSLVIQGDESAINRAVNLIEELDQPRRQVMLDVRIEEISHSDLKERGIHPDQFREFATIGVQTDGNFPTAVDISIPDFRVFDEEDATQTLANPRLLALDGTEADLIIGDEIPYEIREVVDGQIETVGFEYADVGITLNFTPTITRDDTITLEIEPEVSSILEMGAGLTPPSVQTRRFTNVISLRDGQTFAVGGLMQDEITKEIRKLPFLSQLPILGRLFQHEREVQEETEIIIFITTHIIDIMDEDDDMVQQLSQREEITFDDRDERIDPEELDYPEIDEEELEELEQEEELQEELRDDSFRQELEQRPDWPEIYQFEFTSDESLSAAELNEIYGTGIKAIDVSRREDGRWDYQLDLPGEIVYEVQQGDTLADISARSGLSVDTILEASWLTEEEVEPGSILVLPLR